MKHTEHERAEERRFVDQFCDLIENGNLLEEMEDPNDLAFMPSARAKHKAPAHDIGIQEKPKKGKRYKKEGKNYQTILVEVLIHAIQKKLHIPHKQNHKRRKML